jgi:FKBP-type peptidyl-prolyl cis-trans isomerase FklB
MRFSWGFSTTIMKGVLMRTFVVVVLALFVLVGQVWAQDKSALQSEKDKMSYSVGFDMVTKMKQQGVELEWDLVAKGMKDASSGAKPLLTEPEVRDSLKGLQQQMRAKFEQKAKEQGEKNKKEGEAFLAANKTKDGVKTTASGLQYKVLQEGKGKQPTADDTVEVQYRGTLIDGAEFDSSYKRGAPASFPVKGVIKGWTEGLLMMKEGSKWQLVIPPELAYGSRAASPLIGPNSTLVFEVELLSVKPKDAAGTPAQKQERPAGKKPEPKK